MFSNSARIRQVLLVVLIVTASFGAGQFLVSPARNMPKDFLKARFETAVISKNILNFLNNSADRLEQIAKADQEYNAAKALSLISEQINQSQSNDNSAIDLAARLEVMARNAGDIRPELARQFAVEGISHGVALVSRLLVYNESLKQLFSLLEKKFNQGIWSTNAEVRAYISSLNESAKVINDLNFQFNSVMQRLDQEV